MYDIATEISINRTYGSHLSVPYFSICPLSGK